MASIADLLESFRNYRGVEDWKLKKLQDMLGNEDPKNIALNEKLMGIGTADLPVSGAGIAGAIKGWHGSPRSYDVMDFSKAGEVGGQQYGWGGYLSSGPEVAKRFTPRDIATEENMLRLYDQAMKQKKYGATEILEDYLSHATPQEMAQKLERLKGEYANPDANQSSLLREMELAHQKASDLFKKQKGSYLYEASMEWPNAAKESATPLSKAHLLDWEKRLSEQSPSVQKAISAISENVIPQVGDYGKTLSSMLTEDPYAGTWYSMLSHKVSPRSLSQNLNLQGVPGATYIDPSEQIPNYVMYDPAAVKMLTRNAVSLSDLLRR